VIPSALAVLVDDHHLGRHGRLDRLSGRLCAAENAIHAGGGAIINVLETRSIGKQTAIFRKETRLIEAKARGTRRVLVPAR
jgi:hypothetical protein